MFKGALIVNAIFHEIFFWHLKGYSSISVFLSKSGIYAFKSVQYFVSSPMLDFP